MSSDDHVQSELDRLGRGVAAAGERTTAQIGRVGPMLGQASSGDNSITVTVSPGGMLQGVDVSANVLGRHPDEVAAEVLRLAQRATRIANTRMHSTLGPVLDPMTARELDGLGMPSTGDYGDEDNGDGLDHVLRRQR